MFLDFGFWGSYLFSRGRPFDEGDIPQARLQNFGGRRFRSGVSDRARDSCRVGDLRPVVRLFRYLATRHQYRHYHRHVLDGFSNSAYAKPRREYFAAQARLSNPRGFGGAHQSRGARGPAGRRDRASGKGVPAACQDATEKTGKGEDVSRWRSDWTESLSRGLDTVKKRAKEAPSFSTPAQAADSKNDRLFRPSSPCGPAKPY